MFSGEATGIIGLIFQGTYGAFLVSRFVAFATKTDSFAQRKVIPVLAIGLFSTIALLVGGALIVQTKLYWFSAYSSVTGKLLLINVGILLLSVLLSGVALKQKAAARAAYFLAKVSGSTIVLLSGFILFARIFLNPN